MRLSKKFFTCLSLAISALMLGCALSTATDETSPRAVVDKATEQGQYDVGLDAADSISRLLRLGQRPKGVQLFYNSETSKPDSWKQQFSSDTLTGNCTPSYYVSCLVSWYQGDLPANQNSSDYFGGGFMHYNNGATVEVDAGGFLHRDQYWLGFDIVAIVLRKNRRNEATVSGVWGTTCASGKYNHMNVIQGVGAVLFADDVETWGPRVTTFNEKCNPTAPRYEGEDLCGGYETLRTGEIGVSSLSEPYPCEESGGSGGGGQSWVCEWFTYEISYDGGLSWYPYGAAFQVCWYEEPQSLRTTDLAAVTSQESLKFTLVAQGTQYDGARAIIYRDLRTDAKLVLAFDSVRTSALDLEASLYGLNEIARMRVSAPQASDLRLRVGDNRSSIVFRERSAVRGRSLIHQARSSAEGNFPSRVQGRGTAVVVDPLNLGKRVVASPASRN